MSLWACHHEIRERRPPEETLGVPVQFARAWATAVAPNPRGGWNFITQTYELGSGKATEFVVLDLGTGRQRIFEGPPDIYTNSNYQYGEQLRARNGRIFFPEAEGHLAYYDPADETVKQLGKIIDVPGDFIYRMTFGPDGLLYGGTQSKGLPTVFSIDPQTLAIKKLGKVGEHRNSYSYAYYLEADPPWLYVAVGQDPWELVALDLRTGKSRVLATRDGDGFMQLDARPTGITATLISKLRTPAQKSETVALVDGAIEVPNPKSQRARLRALASKTGKLQVSPDIDLANVSPDATGTGRVRWRTSLKEQWRSVPFQVKHTDPIPIESLIALPDGTVLGNARQYHGFFRYNPKTRATEHYGQFPLSGGPRVVWNGKVYFSGYPNSALYVFDPKRPWAKDNPTSLGVFGGGAHYPYFLVPSSNGRLYYTGRRERSGVGSAVGFYDPAKASFTAHHEGLEHWDPQGFLVLDTIDRVVLSGRIRPDAAGERATLVVFDRALRPLERLTIKAGMRSAGTIFATSKRGVIVGVSALDHVIYRYDLIAKRLLDWRVVHGTIGPTTKRADGSMWATIDSNLVRIAEDSSFRVVRQLRVAPAEPDLLAWQGDRLYWAHGAELRLVNLDATER